MIMYRIRYAWPDGRTAWATLTAPRSQILSRAAEYVRAFVGGELLSIQEERPLRDERPQLRLLP